MVTTLDRKTMDKALEADMPGSTVEDYESTSFVLVNDGVEWSVLEDSLTREEAEEMASKASKQYGEWMGVYHHVV